MYEPLAQVTSGESSLIVRIRHELLPYNAAITWPQGDVEGALDSRGGGSGEWRCYTVLFLRPNASSSWTSSFVEMDTLVR